MNFRKHGPGLSIGVLFAVMTCAADAQTVVKIGHVAPLTGALAHLGKDNERGARMAIDELNDRRVKIGNKVVRFELLSEDDGADLKQGTAAAQKLVDAGVAGVVGHLNSGPTISASRIYSDAGIPQISPSATNPRYTQQGFKTTFRMLANDNRLGDMLGRYAVYLLKAKAIAIIDDRTAYGQGMADGFREGVESAGGKVVGRSVTNPNATDFTSILTKIRGVKADLIFFGGMDNVAGPMLRQIKQLGMDVRYMGGDGICSPKLAGLAGGALDSDQVVLCAEAGGITPEYEQGMKAWRAKFKSKFNVDMQIYAPYVYDATMALVAAMRKANSADPKKYLPELFEIEHQGVTGKISFDDKGDIYKGGNLTLFTYEGGKRLPQTILLSAAGPTAAASPPSTSNAPPPTARDAPADKMTQLQAIYRRYCIGAGSEDPSRIEDCSQARAVLRDAGRLP